MKIVVFSISAFLQLVFAACGFFLLLLGLNGFSGKQAEPALFLYIVAALASAFGLGAASAFAAPKLAAKTSLGNFLAAAITVVCSAFIGGLVLMIGFFIAVLLADLLR